MNTLKDTYNKLFKNDTNKIIFVYTPPKVGSTTLVTSLRISLGKSVSVIHLHDEIMLSVLTGINGIKIVDLIEYVVKKGKQVFIIDIYRTPIERKISDFFYKIDSLHFNNNEDISNYSMNRITKRFNDMFPHLGNEDYLFKLFPNKRRAFNFNTKYLLESFKNATYVKLRLNDVKDWGNILSSLLKEKIVIINDCITENMKLGNLYKTFKSHYKIPINFLEDIKTDIALNFFLNEKEKHTYIQRWNIKKTGEYLPFTYEQYSFYLRLSLENQRCAKIEYDHYLDNGCYCDACLIQRKSIYLKALKGEKITERIEHNKNIIKHTNQINKNNYKRAKIVNNLNRQLNERRVKRVGLMKGRVNKQNKMIIL